MRMDDNYPCYKCIVRPKCTEKCETRKTYEHIVSKVVAPLVFMFCGIAFTIGFIMLEVRTSGSPEIIWLIWLSSCIFIPFILHKEKQRFDISLAIVGPIFVIWYFLLKLILFLVKEGVKRAESL